MESRCNTTHFRAEEHHIDGRLPTGTPERLDKQLRMAARILNNSWRRFQALIGSLESLIAPTQTYEIHKGLGFKSWPDYIADLTRGELLDVSRSRKERRPR